MCRIGRERYRARISSHMYTIKAVESVCTPVTSELLYNAQLQLTRASLNDNGADE